MNQARRKRIAIVHEALEHILAEIEDIREDEEMAMENIPENMHYTTDKWSEMEEAVDNLNNAHDSVEDVQSHLEDYVDGSFKIKATDLMGLVAKIGDK